MYPKIWMAQHYSMPWSLVFGYFWAMLAVWRVAMGHPHLLQRHTLNNTPCIATVSTGTRDRDPTHATHAGRLCSSTEQPAHLILWPRQRGIARLLRGNAGFAAGSFRQLSTQPGPCQPSLGRSGTGPSFPAPPVAVGLASRSPRKETARKVPPPKGLRQRPTTASFIAPAW